MKTRIISFLSAAAPLRMLRGCRGIGRRYGYPHRPVARRNRVHGRRHDRRRQGGLCGCRAGDAPSRRAATRGAPRATWRGPRSARPSSTNRSPISVDGRRDDDADAGRGDHGDAQHGVPPFGRADRDGRGRHRRDLSHYAGGVEGRRRDRLRTGRDGHRVCLCRRRDDDRLHDQHGRRLRLLGDLRRAGCRRVAHVDDEGAGRVVLRAAEWTSKSDNRTAVFTIHVGTADTSEASAEIAVVQLRVDDYYYLYGASVPRYEAIDAALQMTKQEEGVYTAETYFAADGTNPVRINKDSRTASLSLLRAGGGRDGRRDRIGRGTAPAGPEIDADGLRTLTVDFNRMTWQWGAHYDAQLPARRSGGRLSDQSLRHTARNLQDVDDAQPRLGRRRRHRCLQIGLPAGFQRDEQGYGRLQLEDRPHVQLPQHGGA